MENIKQFLINQGFEILDILSNEVVYHSTNQDSAQKILNTNIFLGSIDNLSGSVINFDFSYDGFVFATLEPQYDYGSVCLEVGIKKGYKVLNNRSFDEEIIFINNDVDFITEYLI